MSASAGKVMPRPMGDYNAATEYKVLDIVTYNDRPYMAKQTTQGNLPTNTTYWMLLLDFPTEVDNVPTENSNNLVKSGGVYSSVSNKMDIDAGNARNIALCDRVSARKITFFVGDISKPSGTDQDVTVTETYTSDAAHYANMAYQRLLAYVGDPTVWFYSNRIEGDPVYINLSSVTINNGTVTGVGKLVTDNTEAISLEAAGLFGYVRASGYFNLVNGNSTAVGSYSRANGTSCVARGTACAADGTESVAAGTNSYAGGNGTLSTGYQSSAIGDHTEAAYNNQLAMGMYNYNRSGNMLEIGYGSVSTRKNVFEVTGTGYVSQDNDTTRFKFTKVSNEFGFYDKSGSFHTFKPYKELVNNSVTLSTSADTTVTFSDASITADSTIEPFTSVYSIVPKDCVASAGQCVVTIPKQSTAQTIKVKIRVS